MNVEFFITLFSKKKANQKNARQKLKDAVSTRVHHGRDLQTVVTTIAESLTACFKQKISKSDPELMAAEHKMEYLKCKMDVRDAILRRNANVTENTIWRIENSQYSRAFSYELEKLKQLHLLLQALGAFTQELPSIDRSITELRNTPHARPEVECAVLALLTLLCENTTRMETWEDMRDALKMINIRTKMKHIEEKEIPTDTATRVKSILEKYSLSAVQQSNIAAGEIYKWMLNFLIDNIFVVFGGKVFQQIVGIPMGTNCAPLLADIFLYSYEAEFIQSLVSEGKRYLASDFNFTYRYIDDVLSINNPNFADYLSSIYPSELEVKETTETDNSAS
ncbi:hypothetical protein FSP39_000522 [Pinctada imbricata]|uniref:Reverse transcriptase domain-containing protein n=1 Tax=Pinctada imbricata TaxID=66713 RepID=A0AA88YGK3_PINIB|nr:hypothetical protein FSP39_000522 [Pinctada imbricata]